MKNSILGNSHFPRNMRNTIQAADRYGISDRAFADILNNFLIDLDMVNETDQSMIIDRNKIRKHRHKERQLSIRYRKNENFQDISSLYFDGRIDKHTNVELQSEVQVHYEIHFEELIILISQPGDILLIISPLTLERRLILLMELSM